MLLPKSQKGFAHVLLILVILGLFLVAIWWFFLRGQSLLPSQPTPSAWNSLKSKATADTGIYIGQNNTPRLISGKFSGYENKRTPEEIAWTFLEENKSLYKLENPKKELKLENLQKYADFTAVKFSQLYKDIPVFGALIVVRVTTDLKIDSVSSSFVSNINISTVPKISKEEALKASQEDLSSPADLVIYAPAVYNREGISELAWKITGSSQDLFISAVSGKLIHSYATSYSAVNREIYANQETAANPGTLWINEKGNAPNLPAQTPDNEAKAAFKNLGITYDYYSNRLSRDGWDGKGTKIVSAVHFREKPNKVYNNSSWSFSEQRIRFGTGWGFALDITAHELTHGVIQTTSNLNYQGQSGAINESLADIFGTFTEFYNGGNNWVIGEGNSNVLRDMKNPATLNQPNRFGDPLYQLPASVCGSGNDFCGVHTNSSLVNKVAQLLVEGGINSGYIILPLGQEKTEQLFYYLMTQRLTASSQFSDLRAEAIESAKSGFTGAEAKYTFTDFEKASVINVFASVGLSTDDNNFDGVPDDQKDPGSGIVVVTSNKSAEEVYKTDCPLSEDFIIRVLPKAYGKENIKTSDILYKYSEDKDYSKGELIKTGNFDEGGELKLGIWYQFKINKLPQSGEVSYQINFSGQNAGAQKLEGKFKVLDCGSKSSLLDTVKTKIETKILLPTLAPTLTPTSTPTIAIQTKNLTVSSDSRLDGFISSNSRIGDDPVAGELSPGSRAFLSFDLSGLPDNAAVQSAQLSLDGTISTGEPFSLGNLVLYDLFYDNLDNGDYRIDATRIGSTNSLSNNSFDVTSYVKSRISNKKFQIRMQFDNDSSDNGSVDYLTFPSDRMKLKIEYNN